MCNVYIGYCMFFTKCMYTNGVTVLASCKIQCEWRMECDVIFLFSFFFSRLKTQDFRFEMICDIHFLNYSKILHTWCCKFLIVDCWLLFVHWHCTCQKDFQDFRSWRIEEIFFWVGRIYTMYNAHYSTQTCFVKWIFYD